MGSFFQDLNLAVESSTLIQPLEATERRTMYLTNIDQSFNFHVKVVLFFPAITDEPLHSVLQKWQLGIAKLLVSYDFLAGRLRVNEESGRLEIDCNRAGVGFVVASTELDLEDLGELGLNNPAMKKLVPMPELEDQILEDQLLFAFQVTCFKCGSYALSLSMNHTTFDGAGTHQFLLNLSSLRFGKPHLPIPPFTDRSILAARFPPQTTSPHFTTFDNDIQRLPISTTPTQNLNKNKVALQFREFTLDAKHISFLKAKARNLLDAGGVSSPESAITTTFNVVTAHIWRSKALATNDGRNNYDKPSRLVYPVDMRRRPNSPFPASYSGNGILPAYASATCRDLEEGPFSRIVEMVAEGAERINDEYAEYMIHSEMEKGYPIGDVFVTSWRRMAFEEMDFGWGKSTYMCRFPLMKSEMIIMYSGVKKGSISALVGLPSRSMKIFHNLFYKPFLDPQQHRQDL